MLRQPANAHEAQVSPPNSTPPSNLTLPISILSSDPYLLGVVLASEGGLAGADLGTNPGDVELEVVSVLLLTVVGLTGIQQDHPLEKLEMKLR